MAMIRTVYESSPFFGMLLPGDDLISVNGKKIHDLLDYMFYTAVGDTVSVTVLRGGKEQTFTAAANAEEPDLRLEFEEFLLDRNRSCKNKCVFCFIDQLPKGMRNTLYYRDDDFRLSLLQGNYVTLTNLSEEDVERILALKISPLNVSVHTTNPELRVRMMANPNAARINDLLRRFADGRINMRCQIVLCRNLNDGEELDRTLRDLKALYPAVSSVSIVPVGLTKFREGLYPLLPFDAESAADAIRRINAVGDTCVKELGTRLFYPADEFYILSGIPFPGYAFYEEFEQFENGVGMVVSFAQEFADAIRTVRPDKRYFDCSLVTGVASERLIRLCMDGMKKKLPNLDARLYSIQNDFFGRSITVTGLITGQDLIHQLSGQKLGKNLLIPTSMLRDDTFLDDVTVKDVEQALNVRVWKVAGHAEDLIETVMECAVGKGRK